MSASAVVRAGRRAGVIALLSVAAAFPAAAPAATVAEPGAQTAVREYGGTLVFSDFDHQAGRWYLSVRKAGLKSAHRLAVEPSATPFDADVGTDSQGRPELIYQRCALTTKNLGTDAMPIMVSTRTGCELFVYSLADSSGERPVRNANDASHNDVAATLWRGRIAWAREYGSSGKENDVVYTKTLTAPRSQPSKRLPGVPQTRCGDVDPVCGATSNRNVEALELWGDNLAVTVDYTCTGCSGIAQRELRLDRVSDATSRNVASLVSGLNGQQMVGPSFFDGRLAWYRACAVSESSCRTIVGPWRYKLSARTYERGAAGPIRVQGFADTGSRLYEVLGCADAEAGAQYNTDCRIDELAPPAYSPASAPTR